MSSIFLVSVADSGERRGVSPTCLGVCPRRAHSTPRLSPLFITTRRRAVRLPETSAADAAPHRKVQVDESVRCRGLDEAHCERQNPELISLFFIRFSDTNFSFTRQNVLVTS